nr:unnamed protein product [Callosobruchus analis]
MYACKKPISTQVLCLLPSKEYERQRDPPALFLATYEKVQWLSIFTVVHCSHQALTGVAILVQIDIHQVPK